MLLGVTAFPVACLLFVLWMGAIEDSIPAGVRRAVREPDPPPILAVPVRRTAACEAADWWESAVAADLPSPGTGPGVDTIPGQRVPAAVLATSVLPAPGPLAGT